MGERGGARCTASSMEPLSDHLEWLLHAANKAEIGLFRERVQRRQQAFQL